MKDAILTRKSHRTYTGEKLKETDYKKLMDYLENSEHLMGPLGNQIKIFFMDGTGQEVERVGTYGVIKKAPAYLVAVCKNNRESLFDCGYVFEKLVLYMESLGLGTCWLGGTFNRNQINVPHEEGEFVPVISPTGYVADKRALADKMFRSFAKSDHRMSFEKLFFYKSFDTPMTMESGDRNRYQDIENFKAVRLAPSASNKQPWRILMDEEDVAHLYIERTPNYGSGRLSYDIQMVDMGIAASHYDLVAGPLDFVKLDLDVDMIGDYSEYVVSMKRKAVR